MRRTLILGALLVGAAACESKKAETTDTASVTPAATPAASAPTAAVVINAPAEGDTVGPDVTINLAAEGVHIMKADSRHDEGMGHYHLFLDSDPTPDGSVIPPANATTVHIGTGDSTYTFKGLSAGPHRVIAVVGYGDHTAMVTRRDTVNFVVKAK